MNRSFKYCLTFLFFISSISTAFAADWTQWGRTAARNMLAKERGLPASFEPGKFKAGSDTVDTTTTKNVRWVVKLGSQSYGNATVANGRIFVGTNNATPRIKGVAGDRGVVMAFAEKTGAFLWQLAAPKLGAGKVNDWEFLGICSSPAIDGDRAYVVTNRGEVLSLDVKGMANGNQGPYKEEAKYRAVAGQPNPSLGDHDADIIWRFDMRAELSVFPHNISSSSVLIVGDLLYVNTSNGVDWSHKNIPSPTAPSLVVLNKNTGEIVGEEASDISKRLLHGNWASPTYGKVKGTPMVLFGAGDGWVYAFNPKPEMNEQGFEALKELWRFDANPPHYRQKDGRNIRYTRFDGPSEIIASPVIVGDRVYALIGQDPEHGPGLGALSCIDATKRGDISSSGLVWRFEGIGRSISTPVVDGKLIFAADLNGKIYCLDAGSGKLHWTHDTDGRIWSSPMVADGKLYIGNEDGVLTVLAAKKKLKVLHQAEFPTPIYSSVIAANKALYVATQTHLYRIEEMGQK